MKNYRKIITGMTGTGKTYKALNDCKENGERFIYYSPCKQLVIESYIKYGEITKDIILTGEVNIKNKNGNVFTVYEINSKDLIQSVDTVIVDEAHYITEDNRPIKEIVKKAIELEKNIILLTATLNFEITDYDFEVVELQPQNKEKITVLYGDRDGDREKMIELIEKEHYQTLCFCKSVSEFEETLCRYAYYIDEEKYEEISGGTQLKDKLIIQQKFVEKSTQFLNATTCVAQGLNFPCELVIIRDSDYLTKENIVQMVGRLGRGLTDRKLYVFVDNIGYDTYYQETYTTERVKRLLHEAVYDGFDIKEINLKDIKTEESKEEKLKDIIEEIRMEMYLSNVDYCDYKNRKSAYIQAIEIIKDQYTAELTKEALEIQQKYKEELEENNKFFRKFIEMKAA